MSDRRKHLHVAGTPAPACPTADDIYRLYLHREHARLRELERQVICASPVVIDRPKRWAERDAALSRLAAGYYGDTVNASNAISCDLARFCRSTWHRYHREAATCPAAIAGTLDGELFGIMRLCAGKGPPGESSIRHIIAKSLKSQ